MRPKNFTDGMCVGIVVGGDINDPAPDHSGGMRIFIPGLHGKDVQIKHLAFSSMQKAPTNMSQQTFEGTLDLGSIVYVRKDTGSNMCHILGTANEIYDPDSKIPGSLDLVRLLPQVQQAIRRNINIRIPPQIKEDMINDVRVRSIQEKNELHRHELLAGIPANGAIYPLGGAIVPRVTNVATAIQPYNQVLTPELTSILPGITASLGSVLTSLATGNLTGSLITGAAIALSSLNLPGEIINAATTTMITAVQMKEFSRELLGKFSPQTRTSFRSMAMMTSSIESSTGAGFMTGGKIDPVTYMTNAVSVLGRCRVIGDLTHAMQQLQYDSSLYGTSNLPSITMMIDTPFGIKMPLIIDPTGVISRNIPAPLQLLISAFSSAISSPATYPGVDPTKNLFGGSAGTMFNMFQRLTPTAEAAAIAMTKKLNQTNAAKTFANANKTTTRGGNPFNNMFLQ